MIHSSVRELERGLGLGLQLNANPCANGVCKPMGKDSSSLKNQPDALWGTAVPEFSQEKSGCVPHGTGTCQFAPQPSQQGQATLSIQSLASHPPCPQHCWEVTGFYLSVSVSPFITHPRVICAGEPQGEYLHKGSSVGLKLRGEVRVVVLSQSPAIPKSGTLGRHLIPSPCRNSHPTKTTVVFISGGFWAGSGHK